MYIKEQYPKLDLLEPVSYQYIGRDGLCREESEPVLKEHLIEVFINEEPAAKLVCIPQFLAELVLGQLLTEGMIDCTDPVEQICICESGAQARVLLKGKMQSPDPIRSVVPIDWSAEQVFSLADRFAEGMPLHGKTWATHSCFLARGEELLFQCEDIGRHNALDKAVGYALRHGVNLQECMVYSSGRIPTDMALKAIRSGIPVLASKASPSREAVSLAREYNLTLVCAARRDRMKLFAGRPPVANG